VRPEPRVERDLDVEAQVRPSIGGVGGSTASCGGRAEGPGREARRVARRKTGETRPHSVCFEIGVITAGRAPRVREIGVITAGRAPRVPVHCSTPASSTSASSRSSVLSNPTLRVQSIHASRGVNLGRGTSYSESAKHPAVRLLKSHSRLTIRSLTRIRRSSRDPRSTSTTEAPQSGLVEATTTVRRLGPTDGLAPASVWPHLDSRHRRG